MELARFDDWGEDNDFDYGSLPDAQQQQFVFESLFSGVGDLEARRIFDDVMYNDDLSRDERADRYEDLKDYYFDEYGIDFDELWDWEDFREWYDSG